MQAGSWLSYEELMEAPQDCPGGGAKWTALALSHHHPPTLLLPEK